MKALIVAHPKVVGLSIVREEDQGDMGMVRYRLTLGDGGVLELFERFSIIRADVLVTRYSYHWQDSNGQLFTRWDNAPHHPEVSTHPHHIHDRDEWNVGPHEGMSTDKVLAMIGWE